MIHYKGFATSCGDTTFDESILEYSSCFDDLLDRSYIDFRCASCT